jgi:hypothetical protein
MVPRVTVLRFASARSAVAVGFVATAAAVLAGACRDVVVGDGIDAASELCELLENCYGDEAVFGGCDAFVAMLQDAPASTRQAFLTGLDLEACLASCPAALGCMDASPYCGVADACDAKVDCCGWTVGTSACEGGACCAPQGAACGEETVCCRGECTDGVCGDRPCLKVGELCDEGGSCCSQICRDGVCAKLDCALVEEACNTPGDCCPAEEQGYEPGTIVECLEGFCVPLLDQPCELEGFPCDPATPGYCCPGLDCQDDGLGSFQCTGVLGCAEIGSSCLTAPCCGNGICNVELGDPICEAQSTCTVDMGPCFGDLECCSTWCEAEGTDTPGYCATCNGNACTHDVCTTGDPLVPAFCSPIEADCVAQVTDADPWCRCNEWDSICVNGAANLCGVACF